MPTEKKVTRKLAAILSADVKGYSLLMADDEAYTISKLKEYRNRMSNLIQENSGRVVDAVGDNLLADFSSAVDAVQCAVDIQKALKTKNSESPKGRQINFRIGINIGDVVQDGGRIYGTGVNVAARIEALAEPGGVCISESAYNQVKDRLNLGYKYLGEHTVKNIREPVPVYSVLTEEQYAGKLIGVKRKMSKLKRVILGAAVFMLIAAGVLLGLYMKYFYLPAPENIDPEDKLTFNLPTGPSIAVLPFDNMTGNKEMEFFCDGLSENIIATISQIPEFFVIARNSTFAYKGKSLNVQQIGDELGARYVIEGSVHQSDKKIRTIVQLVDAQTGLHKWSETYDRELKGFLELQDEITLEIAKALTVNLKSWGNLRTPITDPLQYRKQLKGWSYYFRQTPESNQQALVTAKELIDENPKNQSAYILLALAYIDDLWFGNCESPIVCLGRATEAVRKALSINNNYHLAHLAASYIYLLKGEHDKAIDSAKMAISLNPSFADAYAHLSYVYIYTDELAKALDHIKKAIHLNPLPPSTYYFFLGFAYQDSRQYKDAIDAYKKCIQLNPDSWAAYIGMVVVYGHMGEKEKAKEAISDLYRVQPNFSKTYFLKAMPFKKVSSRDFIDEGLTKAGLTD